MQVAPPVIIALENTNKLHSNTFVLFRGTHLVNVVNIGDFLAIQISKGLVGYTGIYTSIDNFPGKIHTHSDYIM